MPTASTSSKTARLPSQAGTTTSSGKAGVMPRSIVCNCAIRSRAIPSPPRLDATAIFAHQPRHLSSSCERSMSDNYVISPPPAPSLPVAGSSKLFPVRRVWCVGRNYLEHIREMGNDEREPPFFFAKPSDALVRDGATIPYPSLTKDLHFEVELVVALKSGGRNFPVEKANDCIYGYGV